MSASAISTAEGKLLQEIRREAEGRILEKDREITAIQDKMAALDRERSRILSSVEDRVREKETELRRQMTEELEKERQRLVAAGLTQATVEERLKAFELEKTAAMRKELDSFARKMDEERLALQTNLDKARAEFQQSLQDASSQRQSMLDDSRKREQELRSQLDAKNRALAEERTKTEAGLTAAQSDLSRYNDEATRAQAAEDRLLGLYSGVRISLREGQVDEAAKGAESIRRYLADPSLSTFSGLNRRRDSDLFTMDLVERIVSVERARTSGDSTRVTEAMAVVGKIREDGLRARQASELGDSDEAAVLYRSMLSALPELDAARTFLERQGSSREAGAQVVRRETVDKAYAALEAAYSVRDWPALDAAFRNLMTSASLDEKTASAVLLRAKEAGIAAAFVARRASDTVAAAGPLREAAQDFAAKNYLEAIAGYTAVMIRYPLAEQMSQAAEELRKSGRALSEAFQKYRDATTERIRVLEAQMAAAQGSADLEADRTVRAGASGISPAEYAALREERDTLKKDLSEVRGSYDAVVSAYRAYAVEEDRVLSGGGKQALVSGRSRMDAFFANDAVMGVLPGMRARVNRYLEAFQAAGQKEVLFNAADIVDGASRIKEASTRERYFKDLETRYAGSASMLEFLGSVKESFR